MTKVLLSCAAGLVGLVGLVWVTGYHDALYTKHVGAVKENARRQVFKQSQVYNDGMVTELMNMLKATPEQQAALAGIIRHRASSYQGEMPYELRLFIDGINR